MTICPLCHDPLTDHDSQIVDGREVLECRSVPSSSKDRARQAIAEMREAIARAGAGRVTPSICIRPSDPNEVTRWTCLSFPTSKVESWEVVDDE